MLCTRDLEPISYDMLIYKLCGLIFFYVTITSRIRDEIKGKFVTRKMKEG